MWRAIANFRAYIADRVTITVVAMRYLAKKAAAATGIITDVVVIMHRLAHFTANITIIVAIVNISVHFIRFSL
jgi:hypothetical protein